MKGRDERAAPRGFGAALLVLSGICAFSMALLLPAQPARAQTCQQSGSVTFTCSGDLSGGLVIQDEVPSNTQTVNVNNLTNTPSGSTGIVWLLPETGDPASLNIDTGDLAIETDDLPIVLRTINRASSFTFSGTSRQTTTGGSDAGAVYLIGAGPNGTIEATFDGATAITHAAPASAGAAAVRVDTRSSSVSTAAVTITFAGEGLTAESFQDGVPALLLESTGANSGSSAGRIFVAPADSLDPAPMIARTRGEDAPGLVFFSGGSTGAPGGGAGGAGATVTLSNTAITVNTAGSNSAGVVGSSLGGRGGTGASNSAGGAGGFGGSTALQGTFTIMTLGESSPGLLASSLGGPGGPGGSGGGGSGGAAGLGGTITLSSQEGSNITTSGDTAPGLTGQSIGGRGGSAGDVRGLVTFAASGTAGGVGGFVNAFNAGAIRTEGNNSAGIELQTIGGGGGSGGSAFGLFYSQGGSGGAAGQGGPAQVIAPGTSSITTLGHASPGILVQSIGGTGGQGGSSGGLVTLGGYATGSGSGGDITITNFGEIAAGLSPSGPADPSSAPCEIGCSYGVLAQSIGGGGGNGGASTGWFSVGGKAAGGGGGGKIAVSNSGSVTTATPDSAAILAQSIGGGGGNGGASVSGGIGLAIAVGGSGGSGGKGGAVTVDLGETAATGTQGRGSHAVHAQSTGGGGGNGAFSAAFSAGIQFPTASLSVGGTGGTGGDGSKVTITAAQGGQVETGGEGAHGLFAQSVGGGGGNGGFSLALSGGNSGALSVAVGGGGGSGGKGGVVVIESGQSVSTLGDRSIPILAQSIGGGGGNGGIAVSGTAAVSSIGVSLGIGGSAGSGNTSNTASAVNSGTVTSSGEDAPGVVAQSIGGGGGRGGAAIAASLSLSGSTAISVGVGGAGGTGGNAAQATAENSGSVETTGAQSPGLMAQSIGGGGGMGGLSITANLATSQSVSLGGSIGGKGKAGGSGGSAFVRNTGSVATAGERSQGILAQSVGGGGGSGGVSVSINASVATASTNSLAMSFGGGTETAGSASGTVVYNDGAVTTSGDLSAGIVAQAIGGGGGNGGSSIAGNVTSSGATALGATIGGAGGSSGSGGTVLVSLNADVGTSGRLSDGIVAQSIGGGGGNGGTSVTGNVSLSGSATQIGLGIGGPGGSGGDASTVTINPQANSDGQAHDITASGDGSRGIVAQSIGGGGGNGGMAVTGNLSGEASKDLRLTIGRSGGSGGTGGRVSVSHLGAITTGSAGSQSAEGFNRGYGILAQSIGGGGGDGGLAVTGSNNQGDRSFFLSVGGGAGSGSSAGDVSVDKAGSIRTHGQFADAILAQSIAGGGGNGGATMTYASTNEEAKDFGVTVGGSGGTGNAGGTVTITNSADVAVTGLGARGLVGQSIGGGGGNGGANQLASVPGDDETAASSFRVGVGGSGGAGGGGGAVSITNSGTIATGSAGDNGDDTAARATAGYGILAQSISSGGGSGGIGMEGDLSTTGDNSLAVSVGGSGAGTGAAGTVLVRHQSGGSIQTLDDGAHAIFAQSIGGGGGAGGTGIKGDVSNSSKRSALLSVGGAGAGGGDASTVQVIASGGIATAGDGAKAILAQSIGGGGGEAGLGIEGSLESDAEDQEGQLVLGIGGSGGSGGKGGAVTVISDSTILTGTAAGGRESSGGQADGIFAQSIGGGGGNGAAGIGGDLTAQSDSKVVTLGLGGGGGGNQNAGDVAVTAQSGSITVAGRGSRGIVAQSIGGSGGDGGVGIDGDIKAGDDTSNATRLDLGIGREAGRGGAGGTVTVGNSVAITTNAGGTAGFEENHAIFAQSIAGGGGNGGIGLSGDVETPSESKTLTLGIGGSAGLARSAGAVTVNNGSTGSLAVRGAGSVGIYVQSLGGGGGSGAVGIAGSVAGAEDAKAQTQLELGLGGFGGGGGDGGLATVFNAGSIAATADSAGGSAGMHGILAQSIGGGGGAGAIGIGGDITGSEDSQALALAIGGAGGSGGNGAQGSLSGTFREAGVGIQNRGAISTQGDGSKGIFAQNIGGGGGNAAAGLEGRVSTGDGTAVALALGATGGSGGDGGTIWVQNLGDVTTGTAASTADGSVGEAHGVFAQSVGGGGGTGNLNGSLLFGGESTDGETRGVALSLGASSIGGVGGQVMLDNGTIEDQEIVRNAIVTHNSGSHGLFAQSVGGGGGTASDLGGIGTEEGSEPWSAAVDLGAGGAGGAGGAVTLRQRGGSIETFGDGAYGAFAQSIGGGGGTGGDAAFKLNTQNASLSFDLGGKDGSAGNGGDVTVGFLGQSGSATTISTSGRAAAGLFAQSVGGGGGKAGTGAVASSTTVKLGGSGNSSGNGGDVSLSLIFTDISTSEAQSPGVVAQSVGGGGGYAGKVLFRSTGDFGSGLDLGSGSNTSGAGGDVLLELGGSNSRIATSGANAPGILAQSVAGGGGVAGQQSGGALIGSAGGSGSAGDVDLQIREFATVSTSGAQSHAIFAQSAGGSGSATTTTPKVLVQVNGSVQATGAGSHGVYAQSSGNGRGPVWVTVLGEVVGGGNSKVGAEPGSAIFIKDGTSNRITNQGRIASSLGSDGVAITSTGSGTTQIFNIGTIEGDVITTSSTMLVNEAGAVLQGGELQVGTVENDGFLDIGPTDAIGSTILLGDLTQSSLGTIEIDLDPSLLNGVDQLDDQLLVEGDADLDGEVEVHLLSSYQSQPGRQVLPIIISEGELLFAGTPAAPASGLGGADPIISELEITQSAVAQYQLVQTSDSEVSLAFDIDFANEGILAAGNGNQGAIALSVQSLYRDRALDEEVALDLIGLEQAGSVIDAYNSLSAEVVVDTQIAALNSLRDFNRDLFSCANRGGAEESYRFFDTGQCGYLQVQGGRFNRDSTSDNLGFDASNVGITLGGQAVIDEVWNLGGAFRYGHSWLSADAASSSSTGNEFFFAATGKRRFDAIEISAAGGFGYGRYELERNPIGGGEASADQNLWSLSGQLRAAYLYQHENLFVKPMVGVGVDHFFSSSFEESGSSSFLLAVDADDETYFNIRPAVELGGEFALEEGTRLRPQLSLGITQYLGDPSASASAGFLAGGTTPFTTSTDIDRTRFDIAAGVDLFTTLGAVVRVEGATSLSANSQDYGGSLRIELPF